MVGVTLADAQAYAEWKGKRLPSDVEWEHAAGPLATQRFPWPESSRELALASLGAGSESIPRGTDLVAEDHTGPYLALCRPVGSSSFDTTELGLMDMYANAAEWTESDGVIPTGATYQIVKGNDWADTRSYLKPLTDPRFAAHGSVNPRFGFRCAMSAPGQP